MQTITIDKMLEVMKEKITHARMRPFKIGFLTADRNRKTGGEYRVLEDVTLSLNAKGSGSFRNRTITIELCTGHSMSVHYDLILHFNDIPVL